MLFESIMKSLVVGVPCKATVIALDNDNHTEIDERLAYPINSFDIIERGFVQFVFSFG